MYLFFFPQLWQMSAHFWINCKDTDARWLGGNVGIRCSSIRYHRIFRCKIAFQLFIYGEHCWIRFRLPYKRSRGNADCIRHPLHMPLRLPLTLPRRAWWYAILIVRHRTTHICVVIEGDVGLSGPITSSKGQPQPSASGSTKPATVTLNKASHKLETQATKVPKRTVSPPTSKRLYLYQPMRSK